MQSWRRPTWLWQSLSESPKAGQAVGSQLVQDPWQHLCQLLVLSVSSDGERVGSQRGLNFWVIEVDHRPLVCEHVHLQRKNKRELYLT